ncbi:hypothetical protein Athai_07830 [Actinocatenispora thailandica]|uniref:Nudix hydrolase domain-containing protein n=1 Tax=Actinocatenispora thailandica TaxID=227318 RepID=A0A7R7DK95_9ACTN|nr:NUDIX hydrolase [Actinocatenispora thailandica]BCJ33280.1 hypothetical protein Athai_07830 [Actinocatenispora thailandica]
MFPDVEQVRTHYGVSEREQVVLRVVAREFGVAIDVRPLDAAGDEPTRFPAADRYDGVTSPEVEHDLRWLAEFGAADVDTARGRIEQLLARDPAEHAELQRRFRFPDRWRDDWEDVQDVRDAWNEWHEGLPRARQQMLDELSRAGFRYDPTTDRVLRAHGDDLLGRQPLPIADVRLVSGAADVPSRAALEDLVARLGEEGIPVDLDVDAIRHGGDRYDVWPEGDRRLRFSWLHEPREVDRSVPVDDAGLPHETADVVTSERLGEYTADGRPEGDPLSRDEYVDAIRELRDQVETYFPDGSVLRIVEGPDGLVWVHTRDFGWQRFDAEPGPALGDHPAHTVVSRTAGEPGGTPHTVRPSELLGQGEHGGQHARSWVHEITDTLQRLAALERGEDQGVLRSLFRRGAQTTVDGRDDCAVAQLHERAVVDDRWRKAETEEEREHWAGEIAALDERLIEHGQQPPEHPWETDPPTPPEPPAPLTRQELLDLSYQDPSLKWIREWIAPEGAPGLFGPFSRVGSEHTGVARTRDLQTGEKVAMILRSAEVWGQKFNGYDDPKPEAYRGAMRDGGEVGFEFYTDALPMRPSNCIPGRVAWAHRDYMERWLPAEVVDRIEIIGLRDEGGKDTGILGIKVTRMTQDVPIPAEELQSLLWPERMPEPEPAAEPEPTVEPAPVVERSEPYPDRTTIDQQHQLRTLDQRRLHDVAVRYDADIEVRHVDGRLHVVDVRRHDGTEWTPRQRRALRATLAEDGLGRPVELEPAASARLAGEPTAGPALRPDETVLRFSAHHPPRVFDGTELDQVHGAGLRPKSSIVDPVEPSGSDGASTPRWAAAEPDPDPWHGDPVTEVAPAPRTVRAALRSAADEVRALQAASAGSAEAGGRLDAALRRLAKYVAATGERPAGIDDAQLAEHLDRGLIDDPQRVVEVMRQTRLGHDRYVAFMSLRDPARQELIAGEEHETQVVAHGTEDGLVALPNPEFEAHLDAGGEPADFTGPRSFRVRPELFAHGLAVLEHEGAIRIAGQELVHGHFCLGGQRAGFEAISWRLSRVLDVAVAGHTTETADTAAGSHTIDRRSFGASRLDDALVHGGRDTHGILRVFTPEDPVGRPMAWETPPGFDPGLFADGVTPPAVRAIHTTVPSFLPPHLMPEMAPHEYVGVFEARSAGVGGAAETYTVEFGPDGRWRLTPASDAPNHTLVQVLARNGELVTAIEERLANGGLRHTPVASAEYGADWLPRETAVRPVGDGTHWRVPDDAQLPRWRTSRERHNFAFVRDHRAELETLYRRTIRHLGPAAARVAQNVEWIGPARADLRVAKALGAEPSVLADYGHRRSVVMDSFHGQYRSLYSLARQGRAAVDGLAAFHRQLGRTGPDAELHQRMAADYAELGAEYKRLFGLHLRHRLAVEAVSRSDAELELRRRLDQQPGRLAVDRAAVARRALADVESRIDASLRTLGELDQRLETTAHSGGDSGDGPRVGDAPAPVGRARIVVRDHLVTEFPARSAEPSGRPGSGLAIRVDDPIHQANSASAGERLAVVARSRGAAENSARVVRAFEALGAAEHADPTEALLNRLAETNTSFQPSSDANGAEVSALLVSGGRFGLLSVGGDAYVLRDGVLHQLAGAAAEPAGDPWIDGGSSAPRIAHGAVQPGDRFVLGSGLEGVAPERIEQILTETIDPQDAARQLAALGGADDVAVTVTHVPPAGTDAGGLRDAVTVLRDQVFSPSTQLPPEVETELMPAQTVGMVRARLLTEHLDMFGDGSTTPLAQRNQVLADFAEHRAELHDALADRGAAGPHRELAGLYRELAGTATETARTDGVAGADRSGAAWEIRTTTAAGVDAVDRLHTLHNRIADAESRWAGVDETEGRAGGAENGSAPGSAADPAAADRAPSALDELLRDEWGGDPVREIAPPPRHLLQRLDDALREVRERREALGPDGTVDPTAPIFDEGYRLAVDRAVRLAEMTGVRPDDVPEVVSRVDHRIVEDPELAVRAMMDALDGSPRHAVLFVSRSEDGFPTQLTAKPGTLSVVVHGSSDGFVGRSSGSVLLRPELFAHGLAVLAAEGLVEWRPGDEIDLTTCHGGHLGADSAASRVARVLRTPVLGRTDFTHAYGSHTIARSYDATSALTAANRPFPEIRVFTPEQPTGRPAETEVPAGVEPVRDENGELPQALQGIRSVGPGFLSETLAPWMLPAKYVGMFGVRHELGGPTEQYEISLDHRGSWRRTAVLPDGGLRQVLGPDGHPVTVSADSPHRPSATPVDSARYGLDWLPRESAVTPESEGTAWRVPEGLGDGDSADLRFVRDHRVEIETIWHRTLRHLDPALERLGTAVDWLGHAKAADQQAQDPPAGAGVDRSAFRGVDGLDEFRQRVKVADLALRTQWSVLHDLARTGTAAVRGLHDLHAAAARTNVDADVHQRMAAEYAAAAGKFEQLSRSIERCYRIGDQLATDRAHQEVLASATGGDPARTAAALAEARGNVAASERRFAEVAWRIDTLQRELARHEVAIDLASHESDGEHVGPRVGDGSQPPGRDRLVLDPELITEVPGGGDAPVGPLASGLHTQAGGATTLRNAAVVDERGIMVAHSVGGHGAEDLAARLFGRPDDAAGDPLTGLAARAADVNHLVGGNNGGVRLAALRVDAGRFAVVGSGTDTYLLRDGELHRLTDAKPVVVDDPYSDLAPPIMLSKNDGFFGATVRPQVAHGAVQPGDRFVVGTGLGRLDPADITRILSETPDPQEAAARLAEAATDGAQPGREAATVAVAGVPAAGESAGGLGHPVTQLRERVYTPQGDLPADVSVSVFGTDAARTVRGELVDQLTRLVDWPIERIARAPRLADFAEQQADLHAELFAAGDGEHHDALAAAYRQLADAAGKALTRGIGVDLLAPDRVRALHEHITLLERDGVAAGGLTGADGNAGSPDGAPAGRPSGSPRDVGAKHGSERAAGAADDGLPGSRPALDEAQHPGSTERLAIGSESTGSELLDGVPREIVEKELEYEAARADEERAFGEYLGASEASARADTMGHRSSVRFSERAEKAVDRLRASGDPDVERTTARVDAARAEYEAARDRQARCAQQVAETWRATAAGTADETVAARYRRIAEAWTDRQELLDQWHAARLGETVADATLAAADRTLDRMARFERAEETGTDMVGIRGQAVGAAVDHRIRAELLAARYHRLDRWLTGDPLHTEPAGAETAGRVVDALGALVDAEQAVRSDAARAEPGEGYDEATATASARDTYARLHQRLTAAAATVDGPRLLPRALETLAGHLDETRFGDLWQSNRPPRAWYAWGAPPRHLDAVRTATDRIARSDEALLEHVRTVLTLAGLRPEPSPVRTPGEVLADLVDGHEVFRHELAAAPADPGRIATGLRHLLERLDTDQHQQSSSWGERRRFGKARSVLAERYEALAGRQEWRSAVDRLTAVELERVAALRREFDQSVAQLAAREHWAADRSDESVSRLAVDATDRYAAYEAAARDHLARTDRAAERDLAEHTVTAIVDELHRLGTPEAESLVEPVSRLRTDAEPVAEGGHDAAAGTSGGPEHRIAEQALDVRRVGDELDALDGTNRVAPDGEGVVTFTDIDGSRPVALGRDAAGIRADLDVREVPGTDWEIRSHHGGGLWQPAGRDARGVFWVHTRDHGTIGFRESTDSPLLPGRAGQTHTDPGEVLEWVQGRPVFQTRLGPRVLTVDVARVRIHEITDTVDRLTARARGEEQGTVRRFLHRLVSRRTGPDPEHTDDCVRARANERLLLLDRLSSQDPTVRDQSYRDLLDIDGYLRRHGVEPVPPTPMPRSGAGSRPDGWAARGRAPGEAAPTAASGLPAAWTVGHGARAAASATGGVPARESGHSSGGSDVQRHPVGEGRRNLIGGPRPGEAGVPPAVDPAMQRADAPLAGHVPGVAAADHAPSEPSEPSEFRVLAETGDDGGEYLGAGQFGRYGAAGALVHHDGRFLLVQRGEGLATNTGKWQLPGGAMDSRETAAQGVAREMREEVGITDPDLADLRLIGSHVQSGTRGWAYTTMAVDSPRLFEPHITDRAEVADARWVTRGELLEMADRGELHPALAADVDRLFDLFDGGGTVPERPADIRDYVQVGGQGGSVDAATYADGAGHQRYVKAPASELHTRVEWLANRLYQAAGTRVAEVDLVDVRGRFDGKQLGLSSRMIDGDTALTRWLPQPEFAAKLRRDFVVDAWLANWDVIGEGYNNVLVTGAGDPVRLDTGGALLFRAQGTAKGRRSAPRSASWSRCSIRRGTTRLRGRSRG